MAWSYALRSRGPLLTAIGVVAAAALVGLGWAPGLALGPRPAASLLAGPGAGAGVVRAPEPFRVDVRAAGRGAIRAAADADFLADAEMVMGVQVGDDGWRSRSASSPITTW